MRSEEYLSEIRGAAGLKRAVLKKIVIADAAVTFYLITDLTYRQEDADFAREVSQRYVPQGYRAEVNIMKSVPSEEGVRATLFELLRTGFPAAAAFVTPEDVEVSIDGAGGRFVICADDEQRAQFPANFSDTLSAELARRFCGSWLGDVRRVEGRKRELSRQPLPPVELVTAPRTFPVENFSAIDGAEVKRALCIGDLKGEAQGVTLCGEIVHLEERVAKNDKPYFRLSIRDGSGTLSASYFSKKATVEKVRGLKPGDSVCLTGVNELFNGSFRFTVKQIDYGCPPEGMVFEKHYLPVPAQYGKVHPEPVADLVQADMFGSVTLPQDFCKGKYVVFDLETTGLSHSPVGGGMDRIIEIGAVKIEGGAISQKFSTFVACPVRLSAEIVSLTGIEDEMLLGAPEIGEAIADFYKFCDGCDLVAHNAGFDTAFVRYYGDEAGYQFNHRQYDTVEFAREELPMLSNFKLNTIADYYKFTFHHHRAFDDAFVTAKIFIELVRKKGGLPKPFFSE